MKKPAAQFNCQKGDTVIVERRQRGRLVRRTLTIVRTGIKNEQGCPLSFLAAGKGSRQVTLAPFEDSEDLRVVILPKELPAELAGFKAHPAVMVARVPGCDRYTYRLISRRNLEPVCRVRVERQTQDIQFSDGTWRAKDEEVASATEFLSAGGRRMTLKGLRIES
jgi:hypothetical protein